MQPLVKWMRRVLPGPVLSMAVVCVVLIEAVYWICIFRNWFPVPFVFSQLRLFVLTACSLAYGIQRATLFHPALNVDYRRWLELTPWTFKKDLPAGPLTLAPQDLIVVLILVCLHHEFTPQLLLLPVMFLFGYVFMLACIHRLIGQWALGYAVMFGLAGIPLIHEVPEYILALEVVCYLLTAWAIHRSLQAFPWKLPEVFESRSFKTAAEAIKDRRLGWPYDILKPDPPKRMIPISDGICLSLLAGWFEFTLLTALDKTQAQMLVGMTCPFLLISPVFIISNALEQHRSPLSFFGRLFSLRWIIFSFDRIWLVPVLAAITTLGGMGVIAEFSLSIYLNCVVGTGYLLVILVFGPHLERWRLTGKHRITFGWNAATQAAKDFIEI